MIRPGCLMKLWRPQNSPELSATGTTGAGSAAGIRTAAATTHAKATAFGALQKHHADQRKRQKQVDDQDDVFHGASRVSCCRGM